MSLGFDIERKIDVLALVALVLALITAAVQLTGFFKGANAYSYPPDLVGLIIDPSCALYGSYEFEVTIETVGKHEKGHFQLESLGTDGM